MRLLVGALTEYGVAVAVRYPVTAYAACSALGMTTPAVLAGLYAGHTGLLPAAFAMPPLAAASRADTVLETALGALPEALAPLPAGLRAYDTRMARMAALLCEPLQAAIGRAVARYGAARVAIVVASSTAGLAESEAAYGAQCSAGRLPADYSFERSHAFHALVDVLRVLTGARGPGYVVSTACASGNKVFGSARRLLGAGLVDAVLVGGIDTLCQTTLRGFHGLGILSAQPCRPFARERTGMSIGEGGALLLLERNADAQVQLCGVGEGSDAYHMTQPSPEGAGASRAMRAALQDAGLEPTAIEHVNAHGTGTPLNDAAEAQAIERVLSSSVPVTSTKGATGHVLGAAAALEAVFAIAAIERGELPPTLRCEPPDPELRLRIVTSALVAPVRYVLSNAFAFGGSNACVVFGAAS
jgi:3-oxoacyl-[acyl-carrier-protein] synthase-1